MAVTAGTDPKSTEVSVVFQNIDGDGLPTLLGDVVMTVEAPSDKRRLRRKLRGRQHYFPEKNYRMTTSWFEEKTPFVKSKCVKVHGSSKRPPSPRRDITVARLMVGGREVSFIDGHAVNSAWAPENKPTSFRKERKDLWQQWFDVLCSIVEAEEAKGRLVVVCCDANRPGAWTVPGLKVIWHHGPDRIMVSRQIDMTHWETGPKTGDGRVTHPSVKVTLEIPEKK